MANFDVRLFFSNQEYGWSETYHQVQSAISTVRTRITALIALRMALSPITTVLRYGMISSPGMPRDSSPITEFIELNGFIAGSFRNDDADLVKVTHPNLALLFNLIGSPERRNRIFMRGLPDAALRQIDFQTTGGGDVDEFIPWTAFRTGLVGNGFNIKTKAADGTVTYMPVVLTSFGHITTRKAGRPFGLSRGRRLTA